MNATAVESGPWSRRKWWGVVLGLFALQILLVAWFGSRGPFLPSPVPTAPQLRFAGATATELLALTDHMNYVSTNSVSAAATELLALTDPTLFAQGNPHGFSGAIWMKIFDPVYQPPEWTEAPRLLALNEQQLGADFRRFVRTNQPFTQAFIAKPSPRLTVPEIEESPPATSAPSTLRVQGELAARVMQSSPTLPPQKAADLLTNSVVEVWVDGDGTVFSEVLLASSGLYVADTNALAVAKAALFDPLPRTNAGRAPVTLTRGTLVFEWQTLPMPATNAPSAHP